MCLSEILLYMERGMNVVTSLFVKGQLAMNMMDTDIQMRMYLNFGNVLEICSIRKHWLKFINSFAILRPTSIGSMRSSSSVG